MPFVRTLKRPFWNVLISWECVGGYKRTELVVSYNIPKVLNYKFELLISNYLIRLNSISSLNLCLTLNPFGLGDLLPPSSGDTIVTDRCHGKIKNYSYRIEIFPEINKLIYRYFKRYHTK